jgi:hypothetical protein
MRNWVKGHPGATAVIVVLGLVLVGLGVYWFGPQRLFVDRQVAEGLPTPTTTSDPSAGERPVKEPARVDELSSGEFRSLEHETTGSVRIVALEDGSRFVRLEHLATSDGPDLRIYLTDQPLSDDWGVWDDGRYVDLGPLKAMSAIRTTRSQTTWTFPDSERLRSGAGGSRSGSASLRSRRSHTVASRMSARIRMATSAASATRYQRKTRKSWRLRYFSRPQITRKPLIAEATMPATNSPA